MNLSNRALAAIACVVLIALIGVVVAVNYKTLKLQARGKIIGIGVGIYAGPDTTIVVSEVNWGNLTPGEVKNITVYMRNEGTIPVTLSMVTESWDPPSAEIFISLAWDYDGRELAVDAIIPVVFTLTVSPDVTGIYDFTFNVVVIAEG